MTVPAFTFTVTFIVKGAPTGQDDDGNDTFTPTDVVVPGCLFAPGASTEVLGNQDTVVSQPTVYAPTGTVLTAIDQATVPGYGTFDVDGTPENWGMPNPYGGFVPANGVVVKLKNVTG